MPTQKEVENFKKRLRSFIKRISKEYTNKQINDKQALDRISKWVMRNCKFKLDEVEHFGRLKTMITEAGYGDCDDFAGLSYDIAKILGIKDVRMCILIKTYKDGTEMGHMVLGCFDRLGNPIIYPSTGVIASSRRLYDLNKSWRLCESFDDKKTWNRV